ncbi:alpha-L-fucosidase [Mycetocola sp.]|uniref:alpha-L-fucosidase n=1 Tax=Mycetocola sp. TaxID=1871042 RepID=UPI003989F072
MLNFEDRTGPVIEADSPVYPEQAVPEWYRDAKLGFFVHWGLYSVPAWATAHGENAVPTEDAYAWHQYAEWYGNTVRIMNSPTRKRHEEVYGVGTDYEDLADLWHAEKFDATEFVGMLADAGARYVVPTTKHHEGFCLWDTPSTPFNAARRGPKRDLIGEFHDATRAANLRFGVYYSGALDWHVSEFPAIESDTDLFRHRRNDSSFARYSASQLDELVARFRPDLLWNDIDWPDGGKGSEDYGVAAILGRYFASVPDGVVNDRWGVPYHGFLTREYSHVPEILDRPWEATRGLGFSFGYNEAEGQEHTLTGAALIELLVDVVSKNGNLLINVGPRADGTAPELQRASMSAMGDWLRINGDAIYGTRPWIRAGDGSGPNAVAYTRAGRTVFVHVMNPGTGVVALPPELRSGQHLTWLGAKGRGEPEVDLDGCVQVPPTLRSAAVAVLAVEL